ncbi:MAG: hypothetical protein AABX59_00680 [Nanoarchaeota archaeon]
MSGESYNGLEEKFKALTLDEALVLAKEEESRWRKEATNLPADFILGAGDSIQIDPEAAPNVLSNETFWAGIVEYNV